jgi:hypothetical protein
MDECSSDLIQHYITILEYYNIVMMRKTIKKKIQYGGDKGPPPIPNPDGGRPSCPMGYIIDDIFSIYDKINPKYSCKPDNTPMGAAMRKMMKEVTGIPNIPGMSGLAGMAGMAMKISSVATPEKIVFGGGRHRPTTTRCHRRCSKHRSRRHHHNSRQRRRV